MMPGFAGWNNAISKIFEKKLWDNQHLIISLARKARTMRCGSEGSEALKQRLHDNINSMFSYLSRSSA